jgi:hypothetical protein
MRKPRGGPSSVPGIVSPRKVTVKGTPAARPLLRNGRPLSSDLARQVLGTYRKDGAKRGRAVRMRINQRPSRKSSSYGYAGMVGRIRVQRTQTLTEALGSTLAWVALIAFISLKLTEVITWSWWWVLAPLWGGLVLNILAVGAQITLAISCLRGGSFTVPVAEIEDQEH